MRDYGKLVKSLRLCASNGSCGKCILFDDRVSGDDRCDKAVMRKAADAIEELKAYADLYKELTEKGQTVARKLIDAYPEWISVEERLPEVDQPVMICAFGQSVGEGVYRGHDGFHHVWKMYASSGTYWDDEVTHYMPLPDPPKEDDDNGRN